MISKQPNLVPARELQAIHAQCTKSVETQIENPIVRVFFSLLRLPYLNVWNADFSLLISLKLLRNLTTATSLCNAYLTNFAREEMILMELIRNLEIDEKR